MKKTLLSVFLLFFLIAYTQNTFPENGHVKIGITTPNTKLTVKGNIHAEEVVDLAVPNYIFKDNYNLIFLDPASKRY